MRQMLSQEADTQGLERTASTMPPRHTVSFLNTDDPAMRAASGGLYRPIMSMINLTAMGGRFLLVLKYSSHLTLNPSYSRRLPAPVVTGVHNMDKAASLRRGVFRPPTLDEVAAAGGFTDSHEAGALRLKSALKKPRAATTTSVTTSPWESGAYGSVDGPLKAARGVSFSGRALTQELEGARSSNRSTCLGGLEPVDASDAEASEGGDSEEGGGEVHTGPLMAVGAAAGMYKSFSQMALVVPEASTSQRGKPTSPTSSTPTRPGSNAGGLAHPQILKRGMSFTGPAALRLSGTQQSSMEGLGYASPPRRGVSFTAEALSRAQSLRADTADGRASRPSRTTQSRFAQEASSAWATDAAAPPHTIVSGICTCGPPAALPPSFKACMSAW